MTVTSDGTRDLRDAALRLCSPRANLESPLDEVQQACVFFAIHGHHFQQQAVQSTTQALFALRETAQRLRARLFFFDQSPRQRWQVFVCGLGRCGSSGQCVRRVRPIQRVPQCGGNPPQESVVAFLVVEDEPHYQRNDRVTADLSEMLVLTECLDFERRVTINRIEQADECLSTWVVLANDVSSDRIQRISQGYHPAQ